MSNTQNQNSAFDLSVIKPMKGQRGELVFEARIYAESISAAVKKLRDQVAGSGWIVVQSAALHVKLEEAALDAPASGAAGSDEVKELV